MHGSLLQGSDEKYRGGSRIAEGRVHKTVDTRIEWHRPIVFATEKQARGSSLWCCPGRKGTKGCCNVTARCVADMNVEVMCAGIGLCQYYELITSLYPLTQRPKHYLEVVSLPRSSRSRHHGPQAVHGRTMPSNLCGEGPLWRNCTHNLAQ